MAKERIPIPEDVATDVEYRHDRTCCVCRVPSRPTQIHHVDDNPANNDPANLAVLCLTCHDATQMRGGFARKLRAPLVRRYRDEWVASVEKRRGAIDDLLVAKAAGISVAHRSFVEPTGLTGWQPELAAYLDSLPELLTAAVRTSQSGRNTGVTQRMVEASLDLADVLERVWLRLTGFYREDHFGPNPGSVLNDRVARHLAWTRLLIEPNGPGSAGTIISTILSAEAATVTAQAVEETARALMTADADSEDIGHLRQRWRSALEAMESDD